MLREDTDSSKLFILHSCTMVCCPPPSFKKKKKVYVPKLVKVTDACNPRTHKFEEIPSLSQPRLPKQIPVSKEANKQSAVS